MHVPKKLIQSPQQATGSGGPYCCGIFTLPLELIDPPKPITFSKVEFLIDTGSCLSIIPRSLVNRSIVSGSLRAANGSSISTFGNISISFYLPGISTSLTWTFTIAETIQPILGADFFENFYLLVDCKNRLVLEASNISPADKISNVPSKMHQIPSCATVFSNSHSTSTTSSSSKLLVDIPILFPHCLISSPETRLSSSVFHCIPTVPSQPYRTRSRELPLNKRQAVEKEFLDLESSGVIRRSSSPWASAIHVVTKPDGSFRPCGDYRQLNALTIHDSYPMPLISDILNNLSGQHVFSKIDLTKAFHQIPVAEEDIPKTAVITPFGLFEYLMMPFGLRNAAQSFQRHIDFILRDLNFARPYLDDILIYSSDVISHDIHVRQVLRRLHEFNLVINLKKCVFFADEVLFLGHFISGRGVRPIPDKINAIRELKLPKTVTNLRSFLGAVNFYHRFIPGASALLAPLSNLVKGPKTSLVKWDDKSTDTFEQIKRHLSTLVALKFYNPKFPLQLTTDASDFAIGAVLHQINGDNLEPLEFFSKKLNSAQANYSTFDRELLAIHDSVKHFSHILEGRSFTIFTDHKPLLQIVTLKNPSPRQLRHVTFLSEFNFTISHVSGKDNIVADFFSRPDISAISRLSLFHEKPFSEFKISPKDLSFFGENAKLVDGSYIDVSIPGCHRPIVPTELRRKIFDSFHSLHHPGSHSTYELIHTKFIWPNMRRDIKSWCAECIPCQQQKISRHIKPPIIRFPTGNRFEVLHLDIVGPLPMCQGKSYLLTMIDRKTRWPEVVPISSISATTIAKQLVSTWFSRYGIPNHIITDQGTHFEGSLFQSLSETFGFKHIHTASYHPQTNGMIERFHRSLKTSLRCLSITADWVSSLPLVLLGWRNTIHVATGTSPSTLLFGSGTNFPETFFDPSASISLPDLNAARKHFLNNDTNPSFGPSSSFKPFIPKTLDSCRYVWLKSRDTFHMKPRYNGPYKVLSHQDNNTITISVDEKPTVVNLDKVKPAFGFIDPNQCTDTPETQTPSESNHKTPENTPPSIPELPPLPSLSMKTPLDAQKSSKTVRFAHWARLCEPRRSPSLPGRYIRLKQ